MTFFTFSLDIWDFCGILEYANANYTDDGPAYIWISSPRFTPPVEAKKITSLFPRFYGYKDDGYSGLSRKARTAKTKNGIPVITANWLPGTVHGINKRGVQVCPDGARKGTHIWFVGWLQICTETPLNNHIWADERRFCDSTPRSDVNWKTEQ